MGKDPPESESKAKGLISRLRQWTGFGEKKLWDFLELLIVPAVLAFGAFYLEEQASNRQEQIATARYQQEALAKYFDQMTQLLLDKKLRQQGSEAQIIARARTLSTLGELDRNRKGLLLKFLNEADLISQNKVAVKLHGADLSGADLSFAFLRDANLDGANLNGADLSGADLSGANLTGANLKGTFLWDADLKGANLGGVILWDVDLSGANLSGANLKGTFLWDANLKNANLSGADLSFASLKGANLSGADLENANFKIVSDITVAQVKAAKYWKLAKYNVVFRKQLGLPSETPVGTESSKGNP